MQGGHEHAEAAGSQYRGNGQEGASRVLDISKLSLEPTFHTGPLESSDLDQQIEDALST